MVAYVIWSCSEKYTKTTTDATDVGIEKHVVQVTRRSPVQLVWMQISRVYILRLRSVSP